MADQSAIEWCDSTFNPWIGCTKISPACDHCYAEAMMDSRLGRTRWGAGEPRVRTSPANWKLPLRWNDVPFYQCRRCSHRFDGPALKTVSYGGSAASGCPACESVDFDQVRRRVFCASLADVFDNEMPIEWLADLLDLIRRTPNLDWLLLTKRIGNVIPRLHGAVDALDGGYRSGEATGDLCDWIDYWTGGGAVPSNVWLGATICNQAEADRDIPKLLAVSAAVRFVSIEPMLGPIDLNATPPAAGTRPVNGATIADISGCLPRWQTYPMRAKLRGGIDWVIAGGESGPQARPSHPDWFRSLRDQCAAAHVPFLFKQWGAHALDYDRDRDDPDWRRCAAQERKPGRWINLAGGHGFHGERVHYARGCDKKIAGRLLDGIAHNGFPEVVR